MKFKKIIAVLMAVMCFSAVSCGKSEEKEKKEETTTTTQATTTTEAVKEEEPIVVEKIEYEIDPTKPVIALTFDDGPNTTTTKQVLEVLEKYKVKASFFVIGDNITDESGKVMKMAYDYGHEINNHSKTHSYMTEMTEDEIKAEIEYVDGLVEKFTGEKTKFFRPPYIAVNTKVHDAIDIPFICGVGCNDWDPKVDVATRVSETIKQVKDGTIILLHDAEGNSQTVEALDQIIPQLLDEGYQFGTVSELFEAKGVTVHPLDTKMFTYVE